MSLKIQSRLLVILLGCAVASASFSRASNSDVFESGGFYTPANLPVPFTNLETVSRAVHQLQTPDGNHCSGVMVSRDGYFLTNLHCLKDCFVDTWDFHPEVTGNQFSKDYFHGLKTVKKGSGKLQCPPSFHAILWGSEDAGHPLSNPKLVAVGKGFFSFDEKRAMLLSEEELNLLKNEYQDFALLKYEVHEPQACVSVPVKFAAKKSQPLWLASFPGWTHRPQGLDSPGSQQRISLGHPREDISEDSFLQSLIAQIPKEDRQKTFDRNREIYNQSRFLLTNLDAYFGSSGGAIVNENGEMLALLFASVKASFENYNGSTVLGLRSDFIAESLAQSLGEELATKAFDCAIGKEE